ncbi:unnamed protein product, partial [Laminaria digitata]
PCGRAAVVYLARSAHPTNSRDRKLCAPFVKFRVWPHKLVCWPSRFLWFRRVSYCCCRFAFWRPILFTFSAEVVLQFGGHLGRAILWIAALLFVARPLLLY